MSTKNLSRTVIEGGRVGSNKWERRYSHAETRAHEKAYISEIMDDLENCYNYDIEPTDPVRKEFKDKLGPMYRWLHAQIGRPWNEVRSEVSEKFDTRTTAGRHIVHDHLLSSVEETSDLRYRRYYSGPEDKTTSFSRNDFYVDDDGILRVKTCVARRYKTPTPKFDTNSIANWLSGRVVGFVGDKIFFFTPVDKSRKYGGHRYKWASTWGYPKAYSYYSYQRSPLQYHYLAQEAVYKKDKDGASVYDETGRPVVETYQDVWKAAMPVFRQDRKLNDKELVFWNSIPEDFQKIVLKFSPTYVETEQDKLEKKRYWGYR